MIEHKENCLKISGKQNVKLKGGLIKFKNHFKQLAVSFKLFADFECHVKGVKSNDKNNASYAEKYQDHILCSFAYKVVCIDDRFSKPVVLYRGKNAVYRFVKAILEEYYYFKNMIKKFFSKNLVMSAEDEDRFQSSNKCWICNKLFDVGDNKVGNHDHVTEKYRGSAHCSCNINLTTLKFMQYFII